MTEETPREVTSRLLRMSLQGTCLGFYVIGSRESTCSCKNVLANRYRLLAGANQRACQARGKCMLSLLCIGDPDAAPYLRNKGWLYADVCGKCGSVGFGWAGVG